MRYRFPASRFQNGLVQDVLRLHFLHLMLVCLVLVEDEGLELATITTLAPLLREASASTWKGADAPELSVTVGRRFSWPDTLCSDLTFPKGAAQP
jgi:hypothetical protein